MSVLPARRPASEVRTIAWRRRGTEAIVHPNKASETSGVSGLSNCFRKEREMSLSLL
jgi:hypothetical protein